MYIINHTKESVLLIALSHKRAARHFCLTALLILASYLIKLALDSWIILDFLFLLYWTALMAIRTTAFLTIR